MLSLLVLITAALQSGNGFTKLTVCDFFAASDPLGSGPGVETGRHNVPQPLALRVFHPPALAVRQQEEVSLRRKYEEEAPRVPAGD